MIEPAPGWPLHRVQMAFGFGWDFPHGVTEDYFHFGYPYLVQPPGNDVQVEQAVARWPLLKDLQPEPLLEQSDAPGDGNQPGAESDVTLTMRRPG